MKMKNVIEAMKVICSGIGGVFLTLVFQYFFVQPQATYFYNGQKMGETELNAIMEENAEFKSANDALKIENAEFRLANDALIREKEELSNRINEFISQKTDSEQLSAELKEAYDRINNLQVQANQGLEQIEQLQNEILKKYYVDFQNINLIINGIESGYANKVAVINNEKFYSLGFLQYLVDNQVVSSDAAKLFIGNVQSEDKMPVSLFELEPFTSGDYRFSIQTNMKDNYDNAYEEVLKIIPITSSSDSLEYVREYFVDYQYSLFSFDMFYAKEASQNVQYEIIIYGDGKQLKTYSMDRKAKVEHIEVNISGIEFLQIVGRSTKSGSSYYFGITNPYLYP